MTKLEASLQELRESVQRLDGALKRPKDEFMRDSSIKRFELVFDLAWKTIKAFLEEQGVTCASPLLCFKEAYRQGLIAYEKAWIELIKIRNKTVHTYNEQLAEEVYSALPEGLSLFQTLYAALEKKGQ